MRVGRQVRRQPLALRRRAAAAGIAAVRVEGDQVPAADVEAVVALDRAARRGAEVLVVPGAPVLLESQPVACGAPPLVRYSWLPTEGCVIDLNAPRAVVGAQERLVAAAVVLVVTEVEDRLQARHALDRGRHRCLPADVVAVAGRTRADAAVEVGVERIAGDVAGRGDHGIGGPSDTDQRAARRRCGCHHRERDGGEHGSPQQRRGTRDSRSRRRPIAAARGRPSCSARAAGIAARRAFASVVSGSVVEQCPRARSGQGRYIGGSIRRGSVRTAGARPRRSFRGISRHTVLFPEEPPPLLRGSPWTRRPTQLRDRRPAERRRDSCRRSALPRTIPAR